jgi:hypothetical protein
MNIRVVVLIKIPQRFDDSARLLRSRSAVKVDQLVVTYLLTQDREILANSSPIDGAGGNLVHTIICSHAPPRASAFGHQVGRLTSIVL